MSSTPTSASFSVLSVESAAVAGSFSARDLQRRDFASFCLFILSKPSRQWLRTELPCVPFFIITKQSVHHSVRAPP